MTCLLCKVDEYECDEGTRRALFFLIGREGSRTMHVCETHVNTQAFALANLAILTGHSDWAEPMRDALNAPKLRLVESPTTAKTEM